MDACCPLCYRQFRTAAGEVIPEKLREAREAVRDELRAQGLTMIAALLDAPFTDNNPPCTCACHRAGANILH